jgi:hypothetical protein
MLLALAVALFLVPSVGPTMSILPPSFNPQALDSTKLERLRELSSRHFSKVIKSNPWSRLMGGGWTWLSVMPTDRRLQSRERHN